MSLSQALLLGYLSSPHSAFQEHAAHAMRWSIALSSKGSQSTCIPCGGFTFLLAAFTAHLTKSPEGNLQPTDALLSLLVLDEDRTLIEPLHNAFPACFAMPRDEQLHTAF